MDSEAHIWQRDDLATNRPEPAENILTAGLLAPEGLPVRRWAQAEVLHSPFANDVLRELAQMNRNCVRDAVDPLLDTVLHRRM